MSLNISLNNAVSGMRAAQTAMLTVSTNVANANTEGYSRKVTQFTSVQLGGLGAGVIVSDVRRETNEVLKRDSLTAGSELERRKTMETMLSRIESLFGEVSEESSLGAVITDFRDAMQKLSEQPENTGLQAAVVEVAQKVAARFNTMAREIQSQRLEAERGISTGVQAVNAQIDNIDQLNRQIAQMQAMGQSTADMEDKRDLAVKKISEEMNVQYYIRDDGMMVVSTGSGRTLVDALGTHPIDFTPSASVAATTTFDTIEVDGFDITSEIRGGRVAAYIEMRDTTLPAFYTELNQLAQSMRTNVTSTGLATTDSALDPGVDTNLLFVATSATDFVGTLRVHPDLLANPALLGGTPTINLQISRDLADALRAETYSFAAVTGGLPALTKGFSDYANSILDGVASKHAIAKADVDYQETFAEAINTKLASSSEVNIDEELSMLLVFQKGYSACGRVIQATNDMFDSLLSTVQ